MYWVSLNDEGWLSTSHVLTDPGEINRDEGSNDVEAAGCPCSARPIGVVAGVELSGAVDGDVPVSDFIFASSASNSTLQVRRSSFTRSFAKDLVLRGPLV